MFYEAVIKTLMENKADHIKITAIVEKLKVQNFKPKLDS